MASGVNERRGITRRIVRSLNWLRRRRLRVLVNPRASPGQNPTMKTSAARRNERESEPSRLELRRTPGAGEGGQGRHPGLHRAGDTPRRRRRDAAAMDGTASLSRGGAVGDEEELMHSQDVTPRSRCCSESARRMPRMLHLAPTRIVGRNSRVGSTPHRARTRPERVGMLP